MTCELITGSAGTDHVSSADDGSMYASMFGAGRYAVHQGNDLAATMGSANSITIDTGAGFMDGRYWRVTSAQTLTIDSGAQGVNRIDLVGVKYEYDNGTGHETATLVVVKGTATSGTPSVPTYTDGDILAGAAEAFFPLYSITINGIVPEDPVRIFHFVESTVSCPWPVGAVLQMVNSTNPNDIYPGTTWSKIQGMFLLGSSTGHSLGSTGGAEAVTLSTANLPAHTHTYDKANATSGGTAITVANLPQNYATFYTRKGGTYAGSNTSVADDGSGYNQFDTSTTVSARTKVTLSGNGTAHTHSVSTTSTNSGSTGSGSAVSTMPPYKVVNIWERVS